MIDHEAEAEGRLLSQFRASPKLRGLVRMLGRRLGEIDNAAVDILAKRAVDTAEGQQLDEIGDIVGENRQGLADGDYRFALRRRMRLNRSSGEPESLLEVAMMYQDAIYAQYLPIYPALTELTLEAPLQTDRALSNFRPMLPAGCLMYVIMTDLLTSYGYTDDGVPRERTAGVGEIFETELQSDDDEFITFNDDEEFILTVPEAITDADDIGAKPELATV